jgi:membrane protein required for colicin V production
MDGFTLVDGIVAFVIFVSAVLAYSRGLVREILSIAGWVISALVAFNFAPQAEPLVREIPYLGDFITSCQLGIIASFAAVFAVTLIVTAIFTPIFSGLVQKSAISGLDQGLGFAFGAIRGIVLVLVALVIYDYIGTTEEVVEMSKTKELLTASKEQMQSMIPTEAPQWIVDRYEELTGSCEASDGTSEVDGSGATSN